MKLQTANGAELGYGAFELKRSYQKNLGRAFAFAAALHLVLIGGVVFYQYLKARGAPTRIIEIKSLADLGPPPSLTNAPPPVPITQPKVTPPAIGIPKPVPDEEAQPEVQIASQEELAKIESPVMSSGGDSLAIHVDPSELAPADFVPHEVEPEFIQRVEPKYPELAQRSGVTGKVWVKVWVDKAGKVRDVKVYKSSGNALLDESAVEAARQCLYKPAIQNGQPVAVWVTYPYEFTLHR